MTNASLVRSIAAARSSLSRTIEVGQTSKRRLEISSSCADSAKAVEEVLANLQGHKTRSGLRKTLTAVAATLHGIVNGIDRSTLTLPDVRRATLNIRNRLNPQIEASFSDVAASAEENAATEAGRAQAELRLDEEQAEIQKRLSESSSYVDTLQAIRDSLALEERKRQRAIASVLDTDHTSSPARGGVRDPLGIDPVSAKKMDDAKATVKSLPSVLTRPFVIMKAPVIPVFETSRVENPGNGGTIRPYATARNFKFEQKLKTLGIQHFMFLDYVILANQMLVAVKSEFIKDFLSDKESERDAGFKQERKRIKDWQSKTDPETIETQHLKEEQKKQAQQLRAAERLAARTARMTPEQYEEFQKENAERQAAANLAAEERLKKLATMTQEEKKEFLRQEQISAKADAKSVHDEYVKLKSQFDKLNAALKDLDAKHGYDDKPIKRKKGDTIIHLLGLGGKPVLDATTGKTIRIREITKDGDTYTEYKSEDPATGKEIEVFPPVPYADLPEYKKLVKQLEQLAPKMTSKKFQLDRMLGEKIKDVSPVHNMIAPRKTKSDISPSDFAAQLLEVINADSHVKYELVVKNPILHPRNPNISLFWVMPRNVLGALSKGGGWGRIVKWDFPR